MVTDESRDLHADAGFYRKLAEIVVGIKKATKVFRAYTGNHPARAQALDRTHKQITELLAQRAPLTIQISSEGFSCDEVPVAQDHPLLEGFAPDLVVRGIQAIRLLPGVRLEDLQHLTELLNTDAVELSQQGGGRAFLQDRGASTVEVEDLQVKFSETDFAGTESTIQAAGPVPGPFQQAAPSAPAEPTAPQAAQVPVGEIDTEAAGPAGIGEAQEGEGAGEGEEGEEAGEEKEEEEARPDHLEALILELQKTDRPARYENITQELSRWGQEALARGEGQPCLRIMTTLALELRPDTRKEETITRYARWTLRSLLDDTGPQLLIEGFCRGGTVPEDDLVHLLLTVKEETAEAAVHQLLIELEVPARRKLEDLLIQMGDASVAAVRSALAAPSWETVRRLFPLLPRLPAPDAAEILKRLFRHYNPRIRLESVRLVGQMGAEFTDEPLLDALGDTDASVRQGAMAVLGGLRVKAAIPALRQIAEEPPGTRDVEGQMAAIAALGTIGDPEALSTLIALLHRKRWLLRRTTEKLRVAAAYALGKLGGGEATDALQAVAQSARPALRHACQAAVRGAPLPDETEGAR
jgi:hypothetical protein